MGSIFCTCGKPHNENPVFTKGTEQSWNFIWIKVGEKCGGKMGGRKRMGKGGREKSEKNGGKRKKREKQAGERGKKGRRKNGGEKKVGKIAGKMEFKKVG